MQVSNMKRIILLLAIVGLINFSNAQNTSVATTKITSKEVTKQVAKPLDSIRNLYGARYVDYKIISAKYDSIHADTTLTIQDYYKNNFLQKDDFHLLNFNNQGQTFAVLKPDFKNRSILPNVGFSSKFFNYLSENDITYYHVPTPTSILYYQSGFNGQVLNSVFTTNFNKFQNFSIAYKGLRSLGEYQNQLASHTNLRITYSYYNPFKKYEFRTHIADQKIFNEENAGLTNNALEHFTNNTPEFIVRNRMDVNLNNSNSTLRSTRYYFEQSLKLHPLNQNRTQLKINHQFSYERFKYNFSSSDNDYFTNNPTIFGNKINSTTNDNTLISYVNNQFSVLLKSNAIAGNLKPYINFNQINQEYTNAVTVNSISYPQSQKTLYTNIGTQWNFLYKGAFINADAAQMLNGFKEGSFLKTTVGYQLNNKTKILGGLQLTNAIPNVTANFYQSNFEDYNWHNHFNNEQMKVLFGDLTTPWINVSLAIHQLKNYIYYNEFSKPSQHNDFVDYLNLKASNEFKFGKFALNNTIAYQKVTQGISVFKVPELTTRNTFYYANYFFKGKPLYAQIGFNFKYFTKYYANEFNPVINEFYLQNNQQIGNFPMLDFFVNGQIRRTRIYFGIENITAGLTGNNYFVTPNNPYRDLSIRFGLTWNFFN